MFGDRFCAVVGIQKIHPLDVSVLGGLASESAEMPEPELAEPDFGTGTVDRNWNRLLSEPDRTEPNRGLSVS